MVNDADRTDIDSELAFKFSRTRVKSKDISRDLKGLNGLSIIIHPIGRIGIKAGKDGKRPDQSYV